ncbi:MAG: helix-turn-helix transcriptional regulator [Rhodospirillales bacterium]|nr:helix-turn-helix transcriptional regulator [Rhodospirillales bacterium]
MSSNYGHQASIRRKTGNEWMDRRIARTHNALKAGLTGLMRKHRWDEINVQQICDSADVSRSTFYLHFDNKQELLDYCFSTLESELGKEHPGRGLSINRTFQFLPWLLEHVEFNQDLFRANTQSASGFVIFNRFRFVVDTLARNEIEQSDFAGRLSNDQITFINGGVFAVLEQWNRDAGTESTQSVLKRIDELIVGMLSIEA